MRERNRYANRQSSVPAPRRLLSAAVVVVITAITACSGSASTSTTLDGGNGETTTSEGSTTSAAGMVDPGTPTSEFPTTPFVPSDDVGLIPDLPRRVGYANLGDAEIFNVWGASMEAGAEARDLEYVTANANFDPATNVEQIRSFLNVGVAGVFSLALDAASQREAVLEGIEAGVAMFTVAFGPSTCQILTDQYASGLAAAEEMIDHIEQNLDGQGKILMFNLDDREAIRPRYQAVRDAVAAADSEIEIVVDQLGNPQTQEYGSEVMNTVLQSNPEVNVVIGEDAHVLGALAALEAAGLDQDPRWLLVGIGGEPQALDALATGSSPLKIDVSFALAPLGLIPARFTEDWLAGRSIPQVIAANPVVITTAAEVDVFLEDMSDPEALLDGPQVADYFSFLGDISYETRLSYYDGDGVPLD